MISRFSCLHFCNVPRLGRGTDRKGALPWIIWFSIPVTRVMDFNFESAEFPQGNVMAALGWVERRGVAHLVRSVCQTGAVAVLRSRRLWSTREKPSASSRASSMSSLCDVRPAAWRRAVVFHDERPSGSECQLGVGFALVVGSLIDAALIEACPSLPCRASFGVRHERRRVMLIFSAFLGGGVATVSLPRPAFGLGFVYGRCRVGAPSAPRRWRAVTWLRQVDARQRHDVAELPGL